MFSPKLRPDHFLVIAGYQPKEGKTQKVRFSFYGQTIDRSSNLGTGIVNAKDIETAAHDAMAIKTGSFKFVSAVALGVKVLADNNLDHNMSLQRVAVLTLSSTRFDTEKSQKVLLQVAKKFRKLQRIANMATLLRADAEKRDKQ
jgi:hypothetical protein